MESLNCINFTRNTVLHYDAQGSKGRLPVTETNRETKRTVLGEDVKGSPCLASAACLAS